MSWSGHKERLTGPIQVLQRDSGKDEDSVQPTQQIQFFPDISFMETKRALSSWIIIRNPTQPSALFPFPFPCLPTVENPTVVCTSAFIHVLEKNTMDSL